MLAVYGNVKIIEHFFLSFKEFYPIVTYFIGQIEVYGHSQLQEGVKV